jgi:hypothetical protein
LTARCESVEQPEAVVPRRGRPAVPATPQRLAPQTPISTNRTSRSFRRPMRATNGFSIGSGDAFGPADLADRLCQQAADPCLVRTAGVVGEVLDGSESEQVPLIKLRGGKAGPPSTCRVDGVQGTGPRRFHATIITCERAIESSQRGRTRTPPSARRDREPSPDSRTLQAAGRPTRW